MFWFLFKVSRSKLAVLTVPQPNEITCITYFQRQDMLKFILIDLIQNGKKNERYCPPSPLLTLPLPILSRPRESAWCDSRSSTAHFPRNWAEGWDGLWAAFPNKNFHLSPKCSVQELWRTQNIQQPFATPIFPPRSTTSNSYRA